MRSIALLISATMVGSAALHVIAPGGPPPMTDHADAAAESTIAIQRGTRVRVDLENALSTESAGHGDALLLRIGEPVIAGERVVIPAGTLIDAVLDTIVGRSVTQGVAIELLLTRLRYPGGETVQLAPAPVAVPNDSAQSAGSIVRAVVLLSGASEYHLAAGSRMEIVLRDSFAVDRRLTVAAAPLVREGRRSRDERWCWVAGSPGTPDIRIPGTPATPAIGDMPALPGSPDIVVPGIPSPPGKWVPCP
jgi:hypothetical protein